MNPGSAPQIQTLLFGGAPRKGGGENLPRTRTFTVEVEDAADGGAAGALPADEAEGSAPAGLVRSRDRSHWTTALRVPSNAFSVRNVLPAESRGPVSQRLLIVPTTPASSARPNV